MKRLPNRMPTKSAPIHALAALALAVIPMGCGEKPSFVEKEKTVNSSDATAATTHASTEEYGNTPKPGTTGVDPTATQGDPEPPETQHGTTVGGDDDDGKDPHTGGSGSGTGGGTDSPTTGSSTGTTEPTKKMTREESFPADLQVSAEATKDLDTAYLTQSLDMKRNYSDRLKQVSQIVRPRATDQFDQGNNGTSFDESFDQVANRLLDILVVIDDSNSMQEEQANMASKLAPLLAEVSDSDWQIGVVTTDPNESCLRGLIKKGDLNAAAAFATAVAAGTSGSGNERALLTAVNSLKGSCLTKPWIRANSNLAVLIVSDEDNCSAGSARDGSGDHDNNCPGKDYAKSAYLLDYLATIRQVGKTARVDGIFWGPSQTQSQCSTAFNQAIIYADAVAKTGGTYGSICDADYSATLHDISHNIATTLNTKFTLTQTPDAGTLKVYVGTTAMASGFQVTGNVVEFAQAPAVGSKVRFVYSKGAVPLLTSFPLRFKPLANMVQVLVNGVAADPASYVVNVTGPSVDFQAAPAERAKVVVNYTRDVALQTLFSLGEQVRAGTLTVKTNGVATSDYTVNEGNGAVTFNTAPADGATITFTYTAVGEIVLSYPFSPNGAAAQGLEIYDPTTMAPVPFVYKEGKVVFAAADFVEGRRVMMRFDNAARQHFSVDLPTTPVLASVYAYGGSMACGGQDVSVSGSTVTVDGCGFADDVTSVAVRYNFVSERYRIFTFAAADLPAASAWQQWTVLVNDQSATGFVRLGNIVTFLAPLPDGAIVKIRLTQEDKH